MKNELRLGNIVDKFFDGGHDGNGYWDWSTFRQEEFFEIDEYPHVFRPTSITPEWVERFKNDEYDIISQGGGEYFLQYPDGDSGQAIDVGREFKYVHQLQNLYFALTQKELTVI